MSHARSRPARWSSFRRSRPVDAQVGQPPHDVLAELPDNLNTLYSKSTVNGVCSPSGVNANGYGVQLAQAPAPIVGTEPVQIVR